MDGRKETRQDLYELMYTIYSLEQNYGRRETKEMFKKVLEGKESESELYEITKNIVEFIKHMATKEILEDFLKKYSYSM
jgi:hypothetical protein